MTRLRPLAEFALLCLVVLAVQRGLAAVFPTLIH